MPLNADIPHLFFIPDDRITRPTMANWRDEYCAALVVRDRREKTNVALYNACKLYSSGLDITRRTLLFFGGETPVLDTFSDNSSNAIRHPAGRPYSKISPHSGRK